MHSSSEQAGPTRWSRLASSTVWRAAPWWLIALVIVGAALTATGAAIALVTPAHQLSPVGQEYALYFVTRNAGIALMLGATLALRLWHALAVLMTLTALIQCLDAITAAATARYGLIPVDLAYAILFLIGAARIQGPPFWRPRRRPISES